MKSQTDFALLIAVYSSFASPTFQLGERQMTTVTVSGNPQLMQGTERRQLEKAFGDAIKIAQNAAHHLYRHGNQSELFTKYFGEAPTAEIIG